MKKKLLCIGLSISILSSLTSVYASENNNQNTVIESTQSANENISEVEIAELTPEEELIRSMDDNLYSGAYYDDNDKLFINYSNEQLMSMPMTIDNLEPIEFNRVEYSMNDLLNSKEILMENSIDLEIQGVGINEEKNSLAVYMTENTDESVVYEIANIKNIEFIYVEDNHFKTFFDNSESNNVDLNQSIENISYNSSYTGGQKIKSTWSGNGYSATLTTSAVYPYYEGLSNHKVGVVSVGHEFALGSGCLLNGTNIGRTTVSQKGNGYDVAFIELNNSNYDTHGYISDIYGQNTIRITHREAPIKGSNVRMYGSTSGLKQGSITNTGMSINFRDGNNNIYQVDGVFTYNMGVVNGDSGAPIVKQNYDGTWSIVGYNVGGYLYEGYGVDVTYIEHKYRIVPSR